MLNQLLYEALMAVFGSVEVENGGEQADIELDYSRGSTGWKLSESGSHGEQYRVCCPFCRDHKHHLYVSYLSYARPVIGGQELQVGPLRAHCFRRNCMSDKGNKADLERMIGMGMSLVGDGMATSARVELVDQEEARSGLSDSATLDGIRTWVPGFRWLEDDPPEAVIEYAGKRRLTTDTARQFLLGWSRITSPRTGRPINGDMPAIVIPMVMNGRLCGVQARFPDSADGLRYWFHPGVRKRTVLYNLDRARDIGMAVLCEGVFDVFSVGAPGVCCFGHTLSQAQNMLMSSIGKCVVLLPDTDPHDDFDTVEQARRTATEWNAAGRYPMGAHVVVLPAKDAGEMECVEIWKTILRQVPHEVSEFINERVIGRL